MNLEKSKKHFYLCSLIQIFIFIPFLIQGYIGSDWDSYALIGTVNNYVQDSVYLPSRPPGFPIYELFLSLLFKISSIFNLQFEKVFLILQFLILISNNFLIFKFFEKKNDSKYIFYYLIALSPVYLISGFSIIDYQAGLFFGLLAIYLSIYSSNYILMVPFLLSISMGIRLSNLIFSIAVFALFIYLQKSKKEIANLIVLTSLFTFIIYGIAYFSLWSTSLSLSMDAPSDMFCIFNLTNTDHSTIYRLGRFFLKQIDFFGIIGFVVMLFLIFNIFKNINLQKNIHFVILFFLFELSFLRLPTEEGHLLPAFVALVFLVKEVEIKNSLIVIILISSLVSNFLYLNTYDVDSPDSASEAYLNISLKEGLLIQDFNEREVKGLDRDFHYKNGYQSIKDVWKNGCPN